MKTTPYINKGMVRDLSISKLSYEFAYENYNIRIDSRGDSTLLSCTNERGNLPIDLYGETAPNKVTVIFGKTANGNKYTVTVKLEHPADVPFTVIISDTYYIRVNAGESVVTQDFDSDISSSDIKIRTERLLMSRALKREVNQSEFDDPDVPADWDEDQSNMDDDDTYNGGGGGGGGGGNYVPGTPIDDTPSGDDSGDDEPDPSEYVPYYPPADEMPAEDTGSEYKFYTDMEIAPVISSTPVYIQGEYLGYCVLSQYLVIFTHETGTDRIYRIRKDNDGKFLCRLLYKGNLGFDMKYPMETIAYYESEKVQKVYWTDGINQPRSINIVARSIDSKSTAFDFVTTFESGLSLTVEKQHTGSGVFSAGAIQYVATYYNLYGQETNAAFVSPLYYVSDADRGNSPEETVTCTFKITADGVDESFDYLRIYSITYTSEHLVNAAYIVGDMSLKGGDKIIVDNGTRNAAIDPTKILYLGGRRISAYTFSHKDNTMFLGNITDFTEKNTDEISEIISRNFRNEDGESRVIQFQYSSEGEIPENFTGDSLYEYTNQLEYSSSEIKTFKGGEKYRFGLQFSTDTGERSRVFWIGDKINTLYPRYNSATNKIERATAKVTFNFDTTEVWYVNLVNKLKDAGYTKVQLMIAEATDSDRLVIAQGIVNPTVFNLQQRVNNQPFAEASWYMRPRGTDMAATHFQDVNNIPANYEKWDDSGERHYVPENLSAAEIQTYDHASLPYFDPATIKTDYSSLDFSTKPLDSVPVETIVRVYVNRWRPKSTGGDRWRYYYVVLHKYIDANNQVIWKARTGGFLSGPTISSSDADIDFEHKTPEQAYNLDKAAGIVTDSFITEYKKGDNAYNDLIGDISKYVPSSIISSGVLSYDSVRASGGLFNLDSYGMRGYEYSDTLDIAHPTENENILTAWHLSEEGDHYFVDESIVTLNSPEIGYDYSSRVVSNCNFRIVGIAPLSSNITDYTMDIGFGRSNSSRKLKRSYNGFGTRSVAGLRTGVLFADSNMADRDVWLYNSSNHTKGTENTDNDTYERVVGYYIYPWHKDGSIIGWREGLVTDDENHPASKDTEEVLAKLNSKVEANLRFAAPTNFLGNVWSRNLGEKDAQVFNETSGEMLIVDKGSYGQKLYFGNYDALSVPKSEDGYPLFFSDLGDDVSYGTPSANIYSKQGVRIAYKSTSHAVISLGKEQQKEVILPRFAFEEQLDVDLPAGIEFPWLASSQVYDINQDVLPTPSSIDPENPDAYWFIGELYREPSGYEYGGISDDAVSKNTFVPSSRVMLLDAITDLEGLEGDTYYQRWDCIKTYPYAEGYTNSIVDIASVMVESHINLAGRYDRRRGILENVTTSPTNTGMINKAYTQSQTMFTGISDKAVRSESNFPNQITWTGTKVPASEIDEWTHITLANTLDMDGDKGEVRAIRRFSNNLFCFQDKGISEILFNSRTQLSTQQGVPVELANSGKVEGKRYLTEQHGCVNKWSIVETQTGIYFIDDLNKSISVLGQGIQSLSKAKGFDDFIKAFSTGKIWNPKSFPNVLSTYDSLYGDIYFIGKNYALCFNEGLSQFTSFYSYESTQMMTNFNNEFLSFKDKYLWKQNQGDYNVFFGKHRPYYVEYRITPEPYGDKTFTNIEYRADMWNGNEHDYKSTFDVLNVWTEYQKGSEKLNWRNAMPANLQKKFRIWRAFIPRDSYDSRKLNRIRNPWMSMRLTKDTKGDTERMEFHNLLVSYIE